uniref:Uncharacterized protein n=1 Tax=Chromera velia CCMP2878 TaxID=1169474 RepID=A0A0G4I912_9ALVE|eukprot:Cvel_2023.t1-p1 / transcript=Cvel_2023.t1 / gene=Cvel_2023 / organism=Chromera_velia_CCMP2878 / gene_product=hypothetical protein / transcript_product=hypothetical protein / location=Cvel_scaffold77:124501-127089(+) / protein_length=863 / sequence_SO=supercontig / SO=protein_coding / is_pseudo=false
MVSVLLLKNWHDLIEVVLSEYCTWERLRTFLRSGFKLEREKTYAVSSKPSKFVCLRHGTDEQLPVSEDAVLRFVECYKVRESAEKEPDAFAPLVSAVKQDVRCWRENLREVDGDVEMVDASTCADDALCGPRSQSATPDRPPFSSPVVPVKGKGAEETSVELKSILKPKERPEDPQSARGLKRKVTFLCKQDTQDEIDEGWKRYFESSPTDTVSDQKELRGDALEIFKATLLISRLDVRETRKKAEKDEAIHLRSHTTKSLAERESESPPVSASASASTKAAARQQLALEVKEREKEIETEARLKLQEDFRRSEGKGRKGKEKKGGSGGLLDWACGFFARKETADKAMSPERRRSFSPPAAGKPSEKRKRSGKEVDERKVRGSAEKGEVKEKREPSNPLPVFPPPPDRSRPTEKKSLKDDNMTARRPLESKPSIRSSRRSGSHGPTKRTTSATAVPRGRSQDPYGRHQARESGACGVYSASVKKTPHSPRFSEHFEGDEKFQSSQPQQRERASERTKRPASPSLRPSTLTKRETAECRRGGAGDEVLSQPPEVEKAHLRESHISRSTFQSGHPMREDTGVEIETPSADAPASPPNPKRPRAGASPPRTPPSRSAAALPPAALEWSFEDHKDAKKSLEHGHPAESCSGTAVAPVQSPQSPPQPYPLSEPSRSDAPPRHSLKVSSPVPRAHPASHHGSATGSCYPSVEPPFAINYGQPTHLVAQRTYRYPDSSLTQSPPMNRQDEKGVLRSPRGDAERPLRPFSVAASAPVATDLSETDPHMHSIEGPSVPPRPQAECVRQPSPLRGTDDYSSQPTNRHFRSARYPDYPWGTDRDESTGRVEDQTREGTLWLRLGAWGKESFKRV